jgi:hypothetical protein
MSRDLDATPGTEAKTTVPAWRRWPVLAGGAGGLAIAVVVVVFQASGRPPPGPDPEIYKQGHNPFIEADGPTCIGMPVGRGTVVYSVDSSSALADSFDAIRSAVARSLQTLGVRQRFGLVLWDEVKTRVLPMTSNTPAGRNAAIRLLDDVQPSGSTDAAAGIRAAVTLQPDVVCILASKGPDKSELDALVQAVRDSGVAIQCLAVRDEAPTLSALARRTGGCYQRIYPDDLKIWLSESQ